MSSPITHTNETHTVISTYHSTQTEKEKTTIGLGDVNNDLDNLTRPIHYNTTTS